MDLCLLQQFQELEEKELENKIKKEKAMESEMNSVRGGKRDLINRADSVKNSERKR